MIHRSSLEVRTEVVTAATDLFLRCGYQATTMVDIARAVDLSGPALLEQFPTKEAVLAAITEPVMGAMDAVLDEFPLLAEPTRVEQRALIERFVEVLLADRDAARLAHRFTTDTTALDIGPRLRAVTRGAVARLLGTVHADDPLAEVRAVAAAACLVGTLASRIDLPLNTTAERQTLVDCMLSMLAPLVPAAGASA